MFKQEYMEHKYLANICLAIDKIPHRRWRPITRQIPKIASQTYKTDFSFAMIAMKPFPMLRIIDSKEKKDYPSSQKTHPIRRLL